MPKIPFAMILAITALEACSKSSLEATNMQLLQKVRTLPSQVFTRCTFLLAYQRKDNASLLALGILLRLQGNGDKSTLINLSELYPPFEKGI